MKRMSLAIAALLAVVGCKQIEFKDGEVPENYLAEAKKLEGTYSGSFSGDPYDLTVEFEGNKPRLSVIAKNENGCRFDFGNILAADVSEGSDNTVTIKRVYFELNSESCFRAEGRVFEIDISEKDGHVRFDTYLLAREYYERVCRWENDPYPPAPGYPPGSRYVCRDELRREYLNGRFTR